MAFYCFVDFMKFSIDNSPLAIITPHAGGLWHFGNFSTHMENPWRNGAKMAPFDQEVDSNLMLKGND